MALPTAPLRASESALQRVMERQVLSLLHRANNPGALAAAPLMQLVCAEMRTSNPVTALERIVSAALDGDDESAVRLRNVIFDVDFKRISTNAELARRNGISRRHFQRWRAEAVTAIARCAREILARTTGDETVDVSPRRPDSLWRVRRERDALASAADRNDLPQVRTIAANLIRLAETREARAFALGALAEAEAALGMADEAYDKLGRLSGSAMPTARAKLALLAENPGEASEFAQAALAATSEGDRARYRCHALVSQVQLVRGASWLPPEMGSLALSSWERVAMETEAARHLAARHEWEEAERLASGACDRADLLGYQGLLAARRGRARSRRAGARPNARIAALARARDRCAPADARPPSGHATLPAYPALRREWR